MRNILLSCLLSFLPACVASGTASDRVGDNEWVGDADQVASGDSAGLVGDVAGAPGDDLEPLPGDGASSPGDDAAPGDTDPGPGDSEPSGDEMSTVGDADLGCAGDPACVCPRADGTPCQVEFSVLNYNVHGLPLDLTNPSRFAEIGDQLAARRAAGTAPDFVVLQEAFVPAAEDLIARSGYPYVVAGPDPSPVLLSSGLYILSEHPVLDVQQVVYTHCAVADCGAKKGAVAARVQLPGLPDPIVILTTHLQAHSENDAIRIEQINTQLPFLADARIFDYPSVFAGDFNFKARDDHDAHPSYVHFLVNTPYASTGDVCVNDPAACALDVGPDGNTDANDLWWSTNDHQFHSAPALSGYAIAPISLSLKFTAPFNGAPLSDHWGMEGRYRLTK